MNKIGIIAAMEPEMNLILETMDLILDNKISYSQLKRFIKKRKQSSDFIKRHAIGSY